MVIFGISMILFGIFVFFNPVIAHRGGVSDFSCCYLNILVGVILVVYGFYIIKSTKKT